VPLLDPTALRDNLVDQLGRERPRQHPQRNPIRQPITHRQLHLSRTWHNPSNDPDPPKSPVLPLGQDRNALASVLPDQASLPDAGVPLRPWRGVLPVWGSVLSLQRLAAELQRGIRLPRSSDAGPARYRSIFWLVAGGVGAVRFSLPVHHVPRAGLGRGPIGAGGSMAREPRGGGHGRTHSTRSSCCARPRPEPLLSHKSAPAGQAGGAGTLRGRGSSPAGNGVQPGSSHDPPIPRQAVRPLGRRPARATGRPGVVFGIATELLAEYWLCS
jgi:hypothetical protein